MEPSSPALDLLVCPACKDELSFLENAAVCGSCSRSYARDARGATFDFRLEEFLGPERDHWNELQRRGEESYLTDPRWNCSRWLKEGSYAREFGEFCRLAGLVLDVGCGPYGPYQLPGGAEGTTFIGVDPLAPVEAMPNVFRALG